MFWLCHYSTILKCWIFIVSNFKIFSGFSHEYFLAPQSNCLRILLNILLSSNLITLWSEDTQYSDFNTSIFIKIHLMNQNIVYLVSIPLVTENLSFNEPKHSLSCNYTISDWKLKSCWMWCSLRSMRPERLVISFRSYRKCLLCYLILTPVEKGKYKTFIVE